MQLIQNVEPPKKLLDLFMEELAGTHLVETLIFGIYIPELKPVATGAFYPATKTLTIDLSNVLIMGSLHNKGMMFIPSIWYTLIWTFYHELEHAYQLQAEPALVQYQELPQAYEDMANDAARDASMEWARLNPTLPDLKEFGWLGKQLVALLNHLYTKHPEVADEVDIYQSGAAAFIDNVFKLWEFTDKGKDILIEEINRGIIGKNVNNMRCLTAFEFLGL